MRTAGADTEGTRLAAALKREGAGRAGRTLCPVKPMCLWTLPAVSEPTSPASHVEPGLE